MDLTLIISRWTNIPEQNFNPQLDQVVSDYPSITGLPLSREPFFIKYPWILEDIVVKCLNFTQIIHHF